MNALGSIFLFCYRSWGRILSKGFSLLVGGSFARFGRRTTIELPVRISGQHRIALGSKVFIGSGSWLQTLPDDDNQSVAIFISDGVSIAGSCVISAVRSVVLEDSVLLARNVYISDHMHRYTDTGKPVQAQGLDKIQPVLIRKGAWLGQNVVVCPGVTIGAGSVIGANSVVTQDVPNFCVAAGAPARVVKAIEPESEPGHEQKANLALSL